MLSTPADRPAAAGDATAPVSEEDARARLLDARYGRRRNPRRGRILAIIAGLVLVAGTVFVGLRFADQPVRSQTVSYHHIDATRISLTFQVTAHPGTAVRCGVQALDATRGQVGYTQVDVPPQERAQTLRTVQIATQGEAVSAEVVDCEKA